MPVYEYVALDHSGKKRKGIVDAESPATARQKLRGSGVYPVEVTLSAPRSRDTHTGPPFLSGLFRRVAPGEVAVATRQLATLLSAGVPLVSALEAVAGQTSGAGLKRVLAQVRNAVNEGDSLGDSFARHERVFSPVYVNMVRAGELSGSLDLVLERLAELAEHQQALRMRVRAALAYPVFMFLVGCGVLSFLLAFVVPGIVEIFHELQQALPLPTRMLIQVSRFLHSAWWLLLLLAAAAGLALRRLSRTEKGRRTLDVLRLQFPILGTIHAKLAMARFARTLASLLQSGVQMLPALQIVRNLVDNSLVAADIDQAMIEVEAGQSLARPLAQSRWFAPIAVQMIAIGEQSGHLEEMLYKVAETHEREAETRITGLTALLEPVMILLMGAAVGFVVVSILLPLFEMNQLIR